MTKKPTAAEQLDTALANNALAYLASRDRATRASAVAAAIGTGTTAAKTILSELASAGFAARRGSFWEVSDQGRAQLETARRQARTEVRAQTLAYLAQHAPWNGTAKRPRTMSAALDLDEGAVRAALGILFQQGKVTKRGQAWRMAEPANQGRITASKKVAARTATAPTDASETEPATKRCSRCKEHKPLGEFSANRARKSGLGDWCRPCNREARRKPQASVSAASAAKSKRKPTKPAKGERTDTAQRKLIGQLIELLSDLKKTSGEAS